uniref:gamma-glutamyltransferase n=1 Tax=Persicitalea sp. TaxID=3100273 RepID=UPI003593C952
MKIHLPLVFCLLGIQTLSYAQTTTPVKESTGFYQFATDDPNQKYFVSDRKGVLAQNGMIASAHPLSSQVGTDILKKGGNAVDAAIAVMFALAVVHPAAGNVGGGGFMVYRAADGKNYTLDFREKAPLKADRDMYLDAQGNVVDGLSTLGHLASGVPGSVAGMAVAHTRFGKLPWADLLQPAIDLAEKGVVQTEKEARGLNYVREYIQKVNPGTSYFL